jgi:hypothetical protein
MSVTLERLDTGKLDAFDVDELIHRYKRSRASYGSWWEAGEPRRRA